MNGRRRVTVDELWMNLYHLRLTIPVSIIEIPMSNGDWVRCFYPGEAPQPGVKCVLYRSYVSWWWLSARNVSSVKPLTYIMKRPEATQHNITSARRERESASERVRGNHALLPFFSPLLPTAAPFIGYSVYTLLLTYNTCSNVHTSSKPCGILVKWDAFISTTTKKHR